MANIPAEREKKMFQRVYAATIAAIEDCNRANDNEPRWNHVPAVKPADAKDDWVAPKLDMTYEQMTAKPEKVKTVKAKKPDVEPTAEQKAAAEAAAKIAKDLRAAEKKKLAVVAPKKWFGQGADVPQNLDFFVRRFPVEFAGLELDDKDTVTNIIDKLREKWDTETFIAYFLNLGVQYGPLFGPLLAAQTDEGMYVFATLASLLPQYAAHAAVLATIATGYFASLKALGWCSGRAIYSHITTAIDSDTLLYPLLINGLSPNQHHEILTAVRERKVVVKKPKAEAVAAAAPAAAK